MEIAKAPGLLEDELRGFDEQRMATVALARGGLLKFSEIPLTQQLPKIGNRRSLPGDREDSTVGRRIFTDDMPGGNSNFMLRVSLGRRQTQRSLQARRVILHQGYRAAQPGLER